MPINIRPLSFAIGAEVTGVDLSGGLSNQEFQDIHEAWLEHLVLVFPDQRLTEAQQIAFGRRFGELDRHDAVPFYRLADNPEIFQITNKKVGGKLSQTKDTGRVWHSDHAFSTRPAKAGILYCREMPPVGGNTLFANMYLAYQMLSPALRAVLDSLEAVQSMSHYYDFNVFTHDRSREEIEKMKKISPPVAQPVARVHPETGKKSLFVSEGYTQSFVGMTIEESRGLLDHLFKVATMPELTYRHVWSVNDLIVWDNRCTTHLAMADYTHKTPRHMHRITVLGEVCGRPLSPDEPIFKSNVSQVASVIAQARDLPT